MNAIMGTLMALPVTLGSTLVLLAWNPSGPSQSSNGPQLTTRAVDLGFILEVARFPGWMELLRTTAYATLRHEIYFDVLELDFHIKVTPINPRPALSDPLLPTGAPCKKPGLHFGEICVDELLPGGGNPPDAAPAPTGNVSPPPASFSYGPSPLQDREVATWTRLLTSQGEPFRVAIHVWHT